MSRNVRGPADIYDSITKATVDILLFSTAIKMSFNHDAEPQVRRLGPGISDYAVQQLSAALCERRKGWLPATSLQLYTVIIFMSV